MRSSRRLLATRPLDGVRGQGRCSSSRPTPDSTLLEMERYKVLHILTRITKYLKLAGVIEPNDGSCHLNAEGYYTETLNQDYPSIALLHQMIKDRKANIIFAVTKSNKELYTQVLEISFEPFEKVAYSFLKPFLTFPPLSEFWRMTPGTSSS